MRNTCLHATALCALLIACFSLSSLCADEAVMVKDGKSMAVIVVPADPGRAGKYAADELQKYIEKISGARLEIIPENQVKVEKGLGPDSSRIFVGGCRESAQLHNMLRRKDADAFAVKIERQQIGEMVRPGQWDDRPGTWHDVFLLGAGERGTVYAVYDFLECDLGCRWLAPGERWEEIPQTNTVAVATGARVEEPAMKYRQDYAMGMYDWAIKQKSSVSRRHYWPFRWLPNRCREQEPLPINVRGWETTHDGPDIVWGVSSENPEWFAAGPNGVRFVGYGKDRHKGQICFSNPEVRDLLAERISQLFREQPELEFVEVGCADCLPANYCRCEKCMDWDAMGNMQRQGGKRGGHTHRWLAMVNAVAAGLAESDPSKKLLAAAYSSYQEPPDPQVIKPAGNVMIYYCTWDGCRMHGFEHASEDNARAPEMSSHAKHRQWIETWRDLAPGGMIMLEYLQRGSMDGMAGANPRRFINDMRYLQRNGFVGYAPFAITMPWGLNTINRYAIAKAMWNPEIDPEILIRDFCDHAFHAASSNMQDFINGIELAMQSAGCNHCHVTGWMTPKALADARRSLDAALAAAKDDQVALLRLREFDAHLHYMELAGPANNLILEAHFGDADPRKFRKAIALGEQAAHYRDQWLKQHPGEMFHAGWRMRQWIGKDGLWRQLLENAEKKTQAE